MTEDIKKTPMVPPPPYGDDEKTLHAWRLNIYAALNVAINHHAEGRDNYCNMTEFRGEFEGDSEEWIRALRDVYKIAMDELWKGDKNGEARGEVDE